MSIEKDQQHVQPLSRKTTRVAIESPRKTPYRTDGRTSHLGLTVPVRTVGSRKDKSKLAPFNPEDDYKYDSSDGM